MPPVPGATQAVARVFGPVEGETPATAQMRVPSAMDRQQMQPRPPPDLSRATAAAAALSAPVAGMTVHFSPTIHVQGGGDLGSQVSQAVQLSFAEFERLMQRYQQGQARRGYGDIG